MPRRPALGLICVLLTFLPALWLAFPAPAAAQPALSATTPAPTPAPTPSPTALSAATSTPAPTATPTPGGGSGVSQIIQSIFHYIFFPADTLAEALAMVMNSAAEAEAEALQQAVEAWAGRIGEILQAPSAGFYSTLAASSLSTAAALAPALFLLRLALYHWQRLIGAPDTALQVIGDWVTAGALAIAAGPLLDLIVRLSWWLAGHVLGETAALAWEFIQAMSLGGFISGFAQLSLFSGLILIALITSFVSAGLGGMLAITGLFFAFAAANAVLYVLAVIAPPLAVIGVIPQLRWLRSLWLKAVAILALLPVAAGGIFKAGVAASNFLVWGGLLSAFIRLLWLWGAVGFLLALAGLLSRLTLTASVDALRQVVGAVKGLVNTAALAATIAAGGAGAAGGMGTAGAAGGLGAPGMAGGPGAAGAAGLPGGAPPVSSTAGGAPPGAAAPGSNGSQAAAQHLQAAAGWTQRAAWLDAAGLSRAARYAHAQAQQQQLAARRVELQERMARFAGERPEAETQPDPPGWREALQTTQLSPTVLQRALSADGYNGPPDRFAAGFRALTGLAQRSGFALSTLTPYYPEEVGRMVAYHQAQPGLVQQSPTPLLELARGAGAQEIVNLLQTPAPPATGAPPAPPP